MEKRCAILDLVKKNDIDGLGLTQSEMAKMCGVKKTSVNKISQLYTFNNNLTYYDLWEKKRGPTEAPFRTIPEHVYKELRSVMKTTTPAELDIPYASWTANAVRLFLKKRM